MKNDLKREPFLKLIDSSQSVLEQFEAEIRADERMKVLKELESKASKASKAKKKRTRITKELRKEVLRMSANGKTRKEISVLTGLCVASISKIRNEK